MTVIVHSLMQDADDFQLRFPNAVEENMRASRILSIAKPHFIADFANERILAKHLNAVLNLPKIAVRLFDSPNPCSRVPNRLNIGLRVWRKNAEHHVFFSSSACFL